MIAPLAREPRSSAGKARGRDTQNRRTGEWTERTDREAEDVGLLETLLEKPKRSSVIVDFDGTLAPIVPDPAAARAVPGAARTLGALSLHVRVPSPSSPGGPPSSWPGGSGRRAAPYGSSASTGWKRSWTVRSALMSRLSHGSRSSPQREKPHDGPHPPGSGLEDKTVSITIHWRDSPASAGWATGFAESQADRVGLRRSASAACPSS